MWWRFVAYYFMVCGCGGLLVIVQAIGLVVWCLLIH
jgi:hypothetical protein